MYIPQGKATGIKADSMTGHRETEGDGPFLLIRHGCKQQVGKLELVLVIVATNKSGFMCKAIKCKQDCVMDTQLGTR